MGTINNPLVSRHHLAPGQLDTLPENIALHKDILHTNMRSPDLSYVVLMIITDYGYHISEKTIMIKALITISMTIVIMMSFSRRACPPPTQGGALLH